MIYVCLLQLSSVLFQFTFTSETTKLPYILQGKLAHRKASLRTKESANMNIYARPALDLNTLHHDASGHNGLYESFVYPNIIVLRHRYYTFLPL